MIADQNFNDTCFAIIYPTAMEYGRRSKFFMAKHSATAEGENCAYGLTVQKIAVKNMVTLEIELKPTQHLGR